MISAMLSESPALKARYIFRASLLISPRSSSPASHPRDESVSRITNCNLNERPLAVRRDTDPRTKRMGECSYATLVLLMTTINLPNLRTGPLLGPNTTMKKHSDGCVDEMAVECNTLCVCREGKPPSNCVVLWKFSPAGE